MKKVSSSRRRIPPEESLERYDWNRATRGRYASRFPRDAHAVVIASELWPHFDSAESVNEGLRLLVRIAALAKTLAPRTRRTKNRRAA